MARPPVGETRVRARAAAAAGNGRFKGARMRKWGKWVVEISNPITHKRIWLGTYDTAEEAARAYDAAELCIRGPAATLNFPHDPPDIPFAPELSRREIQLLAARHARRAPAVHHPPPAAAANYLEPNPPPVGDDLTQYLLDRVGAGEGGESSGSENDVPIGNDEPHCHSVRWALSL
ncbi:ethylene-responsive transcription factor ERF016-like [Diospyros lotus]|uniref:ethylene-responsive transcription factor ERF016-like n=1 Tax=Diospyros lotus TaxID=55363 RepID=UPI00224F9C31|nr:ethylene-responsive transcription factor ERF016-like [Diospyros lotus]